MVLKKILKLRKIATPIIVATLLTVPLPKIKANKIQYNNAISSSQNQEIIYKPNSRLTIPQNIKPNPSTNTKVFPMTEKGINIISGNTNLTLNPSLFFSIGTNGLKFGTNLSLEYKIGDFTPSIGAGITYYTNFLRLNKKGLETRFSAMINYENDNIGLSLGTNLWNGLEEMAEFAQQTGIASLKIKKLGPEKKYNLNFIYENDGAPFHLIHLCDFKDRYRTAAIKISLSDIIDNNNTFFNMKLFTGNRKKELEKRENMTPQTDKFGNYYPYGFVYEKGTPYRLSDISFSHQQNNTKYTTTISNDIFRHIFQDIIAHSILDPKKQGGFKSYSNDTKFGIDILHQLGKSPQYSSYQ